MRTVALEGKRLGGQELYDLGVVDILAENGVGVLKAARELAMQRADLAKTGVWGIAKVSTCSLCWFCLHHIDAIEHIS